MSRSSKAWNRTVILLSQPRLVFDVHCTSFLFCKNSSPELASAALSLSLGDSDPLFTAPSLHFPLPSWGHRVWRTILHTHKLLIKMGSHGTKKQSPDWRNCSLRAYWLLASTSLQWPDWVQSGFETKSSQQGVWVGRADGERDSSGAPGLFSGNEVTSANL